MQKGSHKPFYEPCLSYGAKKMQTVGRFLASRWRISHRLVFRVVFSAVVWRIITEGVPGHLRGVLLSLKKKVTKEILSEIKTRVTERPPASHKFRPIILS